MWVLSARVGVVGFIRVRVGSRGFTRARRGVVGFILVRLSSLAARRSRRAHSTFACVQTGAHSVSRGLTRARLEFDVGVRRVRVGSLALYPPRGRRVLYGSLGFTRG